MFLALFRASRAVLGDFLFNCRCDIMSRTKEGFQTLCRFSIFRHFPRKKADYVDRISTPYKLSYYAWLPVVKSTLPTGIGLHVES